jgi:BRCT domain type II-containing protein
VLGILEGVLNGLNTRGSSGPVKKRVTTAASANSTETEEGKEIRLQKLEKIRQLYKTAVNELGVEALFGGLVATDGPPGESHEERPEKRLADKAGPRVSNWENMVSVAKWEESMEAVEDMQDHEPDDSKASTG